MDNFANNIYVLLFVMLRIIGSMIFNPILSRRNLPGSVRAGLSLIMALLFVSLHPDMTVEVKGYFDFALIGARELFIGFIMGYVVQLFIGTVVLAGEIIDYQLGLTMGKVYDPVNASQISVTAVFLNTMFIIYFFQSGAYLSFIKMFWSSYEVLPIGFGLVTEELTMHIAKLFSSMYVLAVRMSVPIIATHIITEMGVGILMKAVPQINIFVVNMQVKIVMGGITFFAILTPLSAFINRLINLMIGHMNSVMNLLS